MAYLSKIWPRKCKCGKQATVVLKNCYNAEVGDYCTRCGNRALVDLKKAEERINGKG